jgi:CcmD family protein
MFLQTTPDTSGYMIAGYAVAFTVIGLYLISLYVRTRNLDRDLETLESFQAEKPGKKAKKKK